MSASRKLITLKTPLKSLANFKIKIMQTLKDIEIVIVDDCSTDNTVEILKDYAQKFNVPFKVAETKKNSDDGYTARI